MNLHEQASSICMIGFEGTAVPAPLIETIREGAAGAILFKRNIESPAQTAELTAALKRHSNGPFLCGVDQEGGRVARLRGEPFQDLPPMRMIGALDDEALAHEIGRLLAREVRSVGFDVDFAPVMDVDTNPDNPVIGDRSFARTPERVARLGIALAKGLESEGVASCAKHFPGHGDTHLDSHLALPTLPHDRERLDAIELKPFAAYAKEKLAAVMTSHVVFEAIEPGLPATFSHKVLEGLLRKTLGFEGLIVSDDLEMKAIADRWGMGEAAVLSVVAGVDLLLICRTHAWQLEAIETMRREAERSTAFRNRLAEASHRTRRFAERFARNPGEGLRALETRAHRELVAGIVAKLEAGGARAPTLSDPTEFGRRA